ncbi:hypothetical protein OG625_40205 (plasmid) [Streptomyces sp. NBC_01351]|uniref:hypothetical protein n=1 Tax=Streptomyces sp. NBC_01351 TaxID=2903833 RepID=UPI002E35B03B|nr:hypothetical protein [Streptomyces sp. NBC_01351]
MLTRLRAAAATAGPLLVYLSGRLTVDRRSSRLHLALAGTTAASVRYTALPWEWLGKELKARPAGLTTVLLDLVADKAAWPVLQEHGRLPASSSVEVYGVVSPPGFAAGGDTVSSYTRHWIDQLRNSHSRPANLHLHALAAGTAALAPGALVLPTARELGASAAPGLASSYGNGPRSGDGHAVPPHLQSPGPAPAEPSMEHSYARGFGFAPRPGGAVDGQHGQVLPGQTVPAGAVHSSVAQHVAVPQQLAVAGDSARDPRPHIHALATSGRHTEAAALASAWEEYEVQRAGYASAEATGWLEIRADLARMAGNFGLATQLWTSACRIRLTSQSPHAPEVRAAAAGALYCWTQLTDTDAATETGPALVRLLRTLPTLDPRHLKLAQRRLELLQQVPSRR